MAPGSNGTQENDITSNHVIDGEQPSIERTNDKNKTPRHPRWTRQETLVLIKGKKIAEERGKRGRRSSSVFGPEQLEPKWDFVSSYCRKNGVNRGPIQCRKRWSNLISDFKKIKTWESQVEKEGESFWIMKSDLRRERKLPGFFDREVYDSLDGKTFTTASYQLALVTTSAGEIDGEGIDAAEAENEDEMVEDEETETESGGTPAPAEDGLFQDLKQGEEEIGRSTEKEKASADGKSDTIHSPVPISEIRYQPYHQTYSNPGTENKRQPGLHSWRGSPFHEGVKRRRRPSNDCQNLNVEGLLIKALERNTDLLNAQLEDQKKNCQLDREQKKDHHDGLITALTKITDALEKIANKL